MRRLWQWLDRNSNSLSAVAALVFIVATIAVVPIWISKSLSPEVEVVVQYGSAVMPPDLEAWIRNVTEELRGLPKPPEGEEDLFDEFRELANTGPLDQINRGAQFRSALYKPELLRIDVSNHADRTIPGVRLRLDDASLLWGIRLSADFLTTEETRQWEAQVGNGLHAEELVLPELPPLPPQSTVTLVGFGYTRFARVSGTVPNSSIGITNIIEIKDDGLISLVRRPPLWFPLVIGGILAVLALFAAGFLSWFEGFVTSRTQRNTTYNLACREALAGRTQSSLALLREAVDLGFKDLSLLSSDSDLGSLRETDEFKALMARVQREESPTD